MAITGGFGSTLDLESGVTRRWVIGRDGVKRWLDTNEPVESRTDTPVAVTARNTAPLETGECHDIAT